MSKKLDMIILEIFLLYNVIVSEIFKKNKLQLKLKSKDKYYLMSTYHITLLTPIEKETWCWSPPFLPPLSCVAVVT